jgi:hypothetical protein
VISVASVVSAACVEHDRYVIRWLLHARIMDDVARDDAVGAGGQLMKELDRAGIETASSVRLSPDLEDS